MPEWMKHPGILVFFGLILLFNLALVLVPFLGNRRKAKYANKVAQVLESRRIRGAVEYETLKNEARLNDATAYIGLATLHREGRLVFQLSPGHPKFEKDEWQPSIYKEYRYSITIRKMRGQT